MTAILVMYMCAPWQSSARAAVSATVSPRPLHPRLCSAATGLYSYPADFLGTTHRTAGSRTLVFLIDIFRKRTARPPTPSLAKKEKEKEEKKKCIRNCGESG